MVRITTLDYGAHLPVIDFGFHKFSLEWLSAYVRTARDLGFKALSTNDHLIHSRPWLDAPTALVAIISHSGNIAVGTSVILPIVRGPVQIAKALAAIDILSNGRLFVGLGPGSSAMRSFRLITTNAGRGSMKRSRFCARCGAATASALPDVFTRQRESISNPNRYKNQARRSGSVAGVQMPACAGSRDSEMDGSPRRITRCRTNSLPL